MADSIVVVQTAVPVTVTTPTVMVAVPAVAGQGPPGPMGAASSVVAVDTTALEIMGSGYAACIAAPGIVAATNNLDPGACQLLGCYQGTPGSIASGVIPNAPFTTQGGPPGKVAWLASTSDDAGTGAGKFTGTRPTPVALPIETERFSGRAPQNIVEVEVLDSSNWTTLKTCVIRVPQGVCPKGPVFVNETYQGYQYGGFTTADYLRAASNTADTMLHDGETYAFLLTLDGVNGAYPIQLFDNAVNGWDLSLQGGVTFRIFKAGVVICNCVMGPPKSGRISVAVKIVGSTLYASVATIPNGITSGYPRVAFYSSPITDTLPTPAGDGYFSVGCRVIPAFGVNLAFTVGHVLAIAKWGTALSSFDMGRIAGCVIPSPPADPFHFPSDLLRLSSLQWTWHADARNGAASQDGLTGGFAFTIVGSPTRTARTATWYRDTSPLFLDTSHPEHDSMGYPHTNSFAPIVFVAPVDAQDLWVACADDNPYDWDNDEFMVFIDGTPVISDGSYGLSPVSVAIPDSHVRGRWLTIHSRDAAAATHSIVVMSGGRTATNVAGVTAREAIPVPAGFARSGGHITDLMTSAECPFATTIPGQATTVTANKLLVLVGDDLFEAHDSYLTAGGVIVRARAIFPTAGGPGRVIAESATGRSLLDMAIAGGFGAGFTATAVPAGTLSALSKAAMMPYARRIVALDMGLAQSVVRYALEDVQTGRTTPTVQAALMGGLIDAIHELRPSSLIVLILVPYSGAIVSALGFTNAQHNTALSAVAAARVAFMPAAKDLSGPNALSTIGSVNGNLNDAGDAAFVQNMLARAPELFA